MKNTQTTMIRYNKKDKSITNISKLTQTRNETNISLLVEWGKEVFNKKIKQKYNESTNVSTETNI